MECVSAWFIFVPDSKLLSNMKLKSLLIRFAAVSFAAVMALGCGQEKPIDPDLPEEKDPTQTESNTIAEVMKAQVGGTFEGVRNHLKPKRSDPVRKRMYSGEDRHRSSCFSDTRTDGCRCNRSLYV